MKFGLFFLLEQPENASDLDVYKDSLEQIRIADELGYDYVWLAEHRFTRYGIAPDVLVLAAAAGAITKNVRIGTAVIVLPFHNPILLAEQVAMVDVMSGGRFDFGTGRGYQAGEYRGLGISMDESRSRYEEVMDICIGLWTQDAFSYSGKHYNIEEVTVLPKPLQKPYPPVWVTAMRSPETFLYAANRGYGVISGNPYQSDPEFREAFFVYKEALHGINKPELAENFWALAPCFVHSDPTQAREIPRASADSYRDAFVKYGAPRQSDGHLPTSYEHYDKEWDQMRNAAYDLAVQSPNYLVGDPNEVKEKLLRLDGEGIHDYILWMNRGGAIPQKDVLASMELFAREVMPEMRKVGAPA